MYGFSGYGTNSYATSRETSGIIGPIVKLTMRIVASTYGIAQTLTLRFRQTTLTDPGGNINTPLRL